MRIWPVDVERRGGRADEMRRHRHAHPQQVAAAEGLADLGAVVEQHQLDLLHAPLRGGDGGDVEPLVDLGAPRVVDPGDDLGHVVVLERDPRRHDVGVVPRAHRDERVGVLDARVLEGVAVEPETHHGLRVEARWELLEGRRVLVDDRDLVAAVRELDGQLQTDTPASHDHDLHRAGSLPPVPGRDMQGRRMRRRRWIREVCPKAGGWREPPALGRARRKVVVVPVPATPPSGVTSSGGCCGTAFHR